MRTGDPLLTLHDSLADARLVTLYPVKSPRFKYVTSDTPDPVTKSRVKKVKTDEFDERRPYVDEMDVHMFPQTWGSTALGFGGIGGAAMTTAYTVIVRGPQGDYAVYFSGRLAYHIENPERRFFEDIAKGQMECVRGSVVYYPPKNKKQAPTK